jgi:hypothetical protein
MVLFFLAACGTSKRSIISTIPMDATTSIIPVATIPIAPPPETIAAPTLALKPTATPDTRLPPERWQEWPIVPALTKHSIEIYRSGQRMSLDDHAFSKVGDCQSVKAAFMGYFDIPERYTLGNDYTYLKQTIDNFAGHFNSDGQAVKGGFNAAAVLSPIWSDPKACLVGENPLECELRVTKPIIVIVSLEVWWDGRTAPQYESLMRRILDTIIAHGAVPILATKADNVEGDNSLNLTTAKLAYEYDLPLWNFWLAVQSLPAHGMDTNRKDGFHISTAAWNTRSFTGLEALDSIWRGLVKAAPEATVIQSPSPTITPEKIAPTLQNFPPTDASKAGESTNNSLDRIVFGLSQRKGEGYVYPGVYLLDLRLRQTRQIFGEGVRFQSASPNGKYLLVSIGSDLYRTTSEGADPFKLSDSFYAFGNRDAVWLPNDQIAAVLTNLDKPNINILLSDGTIVMELPGLGVAPVEIYPTSNKKTLYWQSGTCSAPGVCQLGGAWVSNLDLKQNQELKDLSGPALAPGGGRLASSATSVTAENILILSAEDGSDPRSIPLPGDLVVDYAWSPSGDGLTVIMAIRSDYSGKILAYRDFLINRRTLAISEYPQSNLMNPRVLWSPDGSYLFWIGTIPIDNGYKIGGSLLDRNTKLVSDLGYVIGQVSSDYLAVSNATWLPLP